jgi:hypothetical protein
MNLMRPNSKDGGTWLSRVVCESSHWNPARKKYFLAAKLYGLLFRF